jgi:phage-related minor tail protein
MFDSLDDAQVQLDGLGRQMGVLTAMSDTLSRSIGDAFTHGVVRGRNFETVLKDIGVKMQDLVLKASLKPLDSLLSSGAATVFDTFNRQLNQTGSSILRSISGTGSGIMPFAQGGVVSTPTYFPMTGGLGVAGEAGAEAILPLARGADGRLGVRAQAGGKPVAVNVTIQTPDADSFRRSEAQVSAALARAVARGRRAM